MQEREHESLPPQPTGVTRRWIITRLAVSAAEMGTGLATLGVAKSIGTPLFVSVFNTLVFTLLHRIVPTEPIIMGVGTGIGTSIVNNVFEEIKK